MGSRVSGLRVWGPEFGVQGLGFRLADIVYAGGSVRLRTEGGLVAGLEFRV